jgi:quercetin dioxygenase-like cupin family protein
MSWTSPVVSLPGAERIVRNPHGGRVIIHATAEETGGAVGMWETFSAPGTGPVRHVHTRETEVFRVLRGLHRFWCGDSVIDAPPGTVITLPPNVPHHWRNVSEEEGRMFAIVTPGGFERFFFDIARTGARRAEDFIPLHAALGVTELGPGA